MHHSGIRSLLNKDAGVTSAVASGFSNTCSVLAEISAVLICPDVFHPEFRGCQAIPHDHSATLSLINPDDD